MGISHEHVHQSEGSQTLDFDEVLVIFDGYVLMEYVLVWVHSLVVYCLVGFHSLVVYCLVGFHSLAVGHFLVEYFLVVVLLVFLKCSQVEHSQSLVEFL